MAAYRWRARTYQGETQSGDIEADSKEAALQQLRQKGLIDVHVKSKLFELTLRAHKVEEKEIVVFFRQLSTMISAGVPLVQAFSMAEKGAENPAMFDLLKTMRERLESGDPLSDTLRAYPQHFDQLTCSLIDAGEKGGVLDDLLLRLCFYKEKALVLKAKIKTALIYPASIIVVSFIVTTVLMMFVVPVFVTMFADMGGELPLPTRIAVGISDAFVEFWYVVVFTPFLLVAGLRAAYKTEKGRLALDRLLLNLPIMGNILRNAAVARFCRTFSTLTAAGVPILSALVTVANVAGNKVIENTILDARESISQGQSLTQPLLESQVFPVMVTQMISIGEQTGSMESMLAKIADYYEQEVDTSVNNMTSLMEPLIMAFLGVVIGGLVIAMYMPIFQMAAGL
ncbi:MAG: type II secretion system F family protein [Zetaproteobacteria bacterium]|nr:type II secretion system F family protein [Zetaproteobacteria bacterium]